MRFVVTLDDKRDKLAVAFCKAAGRNKKKLLLKLIDSYISGTGIENAKDLEDVNIFELKSNEDDQNRTIVSCLSEISDTNKLLVETIANLSINAVVPREVVESEIQDNSKDNAKVDELPNEIVENLLGNIDID